MKFIAALAFTLTIACVSADTTDEPRSLKERFFHNNTAKFNKYCDTLYMNLAKTGNGTAIDLAVLKSYYIKAQKEEVVPKDLTLNLDRADKDQDGKLTREEFCGDLDTILAQTDIEDLKELSEIKLNAKWQEYVCKLKDKAPALLGGKCPSTNESLVKRQVSADNPNAWKGIGITAMVLGSLAALSLFVSFVSFWVLFFTGQAVVAGTLLIAWPIAILAVAFWFIVGKMSLDQANKMHAGPVQITK
jgi:hypothetical protein